MKVSRTFAEQTMLSTGDLERLIAVKRREIETEKMLLGLIPTIVEKKETGRVNNENSNNVIKQVHFSKPKILTERNDAKQECTRVEQSEQKCDFEDIPADLERYIRRYLGLPVMLKAGEYSPNNPLIRGERTTGDALLGLGEYERRRNTLRKIRQRQYREYLDQQAKIKQEAKEKAERERREREERERLLEEKERERERERELERERYSPERRRGSVNYSQVSGSNNAYTIKVDTGVQVNNISKPLSVAVQTDEEDLFKLSPTPKNVLTEAERELSPRTVVDSRDDRPIQRAPWASREQWKDLGKDWQEPGKDWKNTDTNWKDSRHDWKDSGKNWKELRKELEDENWKETGRDWKDGEWIELKQERRRSYGDFDERAKKAARDKVSTDLKTYKPSIFDADAIELRNLQAEKEATARRRFYQQELKNQILEQQRIREERKTREKMLEQAEMRRLEQQLRSLRAAQEGEADRRHDLDTKIKDDAIEYDRRRIALQKEIDLEQQALMRASQSNANRTTYTSKSDTLPSKLPFYYPKSANKEIERPPYSTNISNNSVFSPNYDVESYLRRHLNPTKESLNSNRLPETYSKSIEPTYCVEPDDNRNVIVEKALIHDRPKAAERKLDRPKVNDRLVVAQRNHDHRPVVTERSDGGPVAERSYDRPRVIDRPKVPEQSYDRSEVVEKIDGNVDPLPIPVLRHSPKPRAEHVSERDRSDLSEAMQVVDDKWKVPVVQKNILKSLPNEEGKNVSILTQLGSIRRQLQLEQLKLDKMLYKDSK